MSFYWVSEKRISLVYTEQPTSSLRDGGKSVVWRPL